MFSYLATCSFAYNVLLYQFKNIIPKIAVFLSRTKGKEMSLFWCTYISNNSLGVGAGGWRQRRWGFASGAHFVVHGEGAAELGAQEQCLHRRHLRLLAATMLAQKGT